MKQIIVSMLLILLISFGISFGFSEIFQFWQVFVLACTFQLIGSYLWNSYHMYKFARAEMLNEKELLDNQMKQYAEVVCPCQKYKSNELIYINGENIFECPICKNKFKVNVDLTSILITDAISTEIIFDQLLNQAKQADSRS